MNNDVTDTVQILTDLQGTDNDARKSAERKLVEKDRKKVIEDLVQVIQGYKGGNVIRVHATVVLGVLLANGGFNELGWDDQERLKGTILMMLENDQIWDSKRALFHLVGQMTQLMDVTEEWKDLVEAIPKMMTRLENPIDVVVGLELCKYCAESLISDMRNDELTRFVIVLKTCLSFPQEPKVEISAIALLAEASLYVVGPDRPVFEPLVPCVLSTVTDLGRRGDMEHMREFLEGVVGLAETNPRIFKNHCPETVSLMMSVIDSGNLTNSVRILAMETLAILCEQIPNTMRQMERLPLLFIQALMRIIIGQVSCDHGELDDDEQNEIVQHASTTIGRLGEATSLGADLTLGIIMELAQECFQQRPWQPRYAGLVGLARTTEALMSYESGMGESGNARTKVFDLESFPRDGYLEQICQWYVLFMSNGDENVLVRDAALHGLGTVCVMFRKEIQQHFLQDVLSGLLICLKDADNDTLCISAAEVIQVFLDRLSLDMFGAHQNLYENLLKELQYVYENTDDMFIDVKQAILRAMVTSIQVSGARPIIQQLYSYWIESILNKTISNHNTSFALRVTACECFATFAMVVGKTMSFQHCRSFLQVLEPFWDQNELESNNSEANYSSLINTYERLSITLAEDFQSYLIHLVPKLLKVAAQPLAYDQQDGFDEHMIIPAHTSAFEDKIRACTFLRSLIESLKAAMFPFVQELQSLIEMLVAQEPVNDADIRLVGISCIPALVASIAQGNDVTSLETLQQVMERNLQLVLNLLIQEEDDPEITKALIQAIEKIIENGSQSTHLVKTSDMNNICFQLLTRFRKSLQQREIARAQFMIECNEGFDKDASELFQRNDVHEEEIRFMIAHAFCIFAGIYKDNFINTFDQVLSQQLFDLADAHRLAQDRYNAIYVIVEVLEHCNNIGRDVLVDIISILTSNLDPQHPEILQASVYGLGVMITRFHAILDVPTCVEVVSNISNVLDNVVDNNNRATETFSFDWSNALENCYATLGKFVRYSTISSPNSALPPETRSIACGKWLQALPFTHDLEENAVACEHIIFLLQQARDSLLLAEPFHHQAVRALVTSLLKSNGDHQLVHQHAQQPIAEILHKTFQGSLDQFTTILNQSGFSKHEKEQIVNIINQFQ